MRERRASITDKRFAFQTEVLMKLQEEALIHSQAAIALQLSRGSLELHRSTVDIDEVYSDVNDYESSTARFKRLVEQVFDADLRDFATTFHLSCTDYTVWKEDEVERQRCLKRLLELQLDVMEKSGQELRSLYANLS